MTTSPEATTLPIERWQVGDVKITRIIEQEDGGAPAAALFANLTPEDVQNTTWLAPNYADPDGSLRISVHAFVIESAGKRIIVDTCVGNDKPRSTPNWNMLSLPFLERLADAGYHPDTIDYVICTHMHLDHVGWNTRLVDGEWVPTFPNARYLFGQQEWDHWSAENRNKGDLLPELDAALGPDDVMRDSIAPIVAANLHEFVATDHQLTADVALTPTPGHTPGHVSVAIASQGQQAVITGDMAHHPIQFADPSLCSHFDFDKSLSEATRRSFIDDNANNNTLVLGTHFATPSGGHIVSDGNAWKFVKPTS